MNEKTAQLEERRAKSVKAAPSPTPPKLEERPDEAVEVPRVPLARPVVPNAEKLVDAILETGAAVLEARRHLEDVVEAEPSSEHRERIGRDQYRVYATAIASWHASIAALEVVRAKAMQPGVTTRWMPAVEVVRDHAHRRPITAEERAAAVGALLEGGLEITADDASTFSRDGRPLGPRGIGRVGDAPAPPLGRVVSGV